MSSTDPTERPDWLPKEAEMLDQPLCGEDGALNEASLNELDAALRTMPNTAERLSNDPEWTVKLWTRADVITSRFAAAVVEGASGAPDGLPAMVNYLKRVLLVDDRFKALGGVVIAQVSLVDIATILERLVEEPMFALLNKEPHMKPQELEWIDLDALVCNTCLFVRAERRHFHAFDLGFERRWAKKQEEARS